MKRDFYTIDPSKHLRDDILIQVDKPARYTGNELNMVEKDPASVAVSFALCFPDVYEVGMSHLGSRILYHTMNQRADVYCERAFTPYPDLEAIMRQEKIGLRSLETKSLLRDFDLVGFSFLYEMSYTNVLNMLQLAGIPLDSAQRSDDDPLIMAGGPCAVNPEPMHRFIDFFEIGEGEEIMDEVLSLVKKAKAAGKSRREILEALAQIPGIYVPSFYDVTYHEDGTIKERLKLEPSAPDIITKRIIKDFDQGPYPDKIIVPYVKPTHDRVMVEAFRGCTRGCRFCMAGMIYRPLRERSRQRIEELAQQLVEATGYEEISLTSLSTCDHSDIARLVEELVARYESDQVAISLPSIRVDAFAVELVEQIQKIRKTGLTFAPEAGSQRMRDIINKNVTEEDIFSAVTAAFSQGWSTIKLYTMIGLPYETLADAQAIGDLANKIVYLYKITPGKKHPKGLKLNLATSIFIPKAFTPFQWVPQIQRETMLERVYAIKHQLKKGNIEFKWHESELSLLEAVISRGDRRVADLILMAFENGAAMDGWTEWFNLQAWQKALSQWSMDPSFYAHRERSYEEILPWDFIDIGVTKAYLIQENEKAKQGITTRDCREGCTACGITETYGGGICFNGSILHQTSQNSGH